MSDNENHSSSSSSSSGSSSPPSPVGNSDRNSRKNDSWSGSEQSLNDCDSTSKPPKLKADGEAGGSEDEESSSSASSSEDGEGGENKSASSSSESSDHDDDKENNSDNDKDDDDEEDEEEEADEVSQGRSRSRESSGNSSARGSQSRSELSDSDEETGDIKKLWERDPDFYGVRRSSRTKLPAKPPKLVPQVTRKPPPKSKKVVHQKKRQLSDDDSSDEEVTRTVRKRGGGVVSYKEQESDDEMSIGDEDADDVEMNGEVEPESEEHVETIEKIMDVRQGKKGATGSATTIYTVEEQGDPNLTLPEDTETETQFFIKWATLSHLHNTWESLETLKENNVKGLKKLDNYCKKEDELNRWKRFANAEDVEYYECQLELQQDLAKSYTCAERIIAEHRNEEKEIEYFIKWDCLPYSDATWESGKLIAARNPEVIEIYKKREASNRTPASKPMRSRPKFTEIKTQPDYMTGDSNNLILRDYQLDGLNWLVHSWCKENSVILADEMGLGKTIQTICFLSYLFETHNLYGPYLLVVPLSTMTAWQKEFAQWAPQINVVTYLGDISSRDLIREYEWYFKSSSNKLKFNAILTTYEIVLKDKLFLGAINWAILLVDEAHRLKNGDSLLYKSLQEFNTNHRLLITGTPLQNSLKELWSLLHFIMPHKFDDWESFEREHDHAATKGYAKLHKQLEPFILRRVKKDVEKSLPAKVEQILRVEMTSLQKQYYKWILTKNYSALRKGVKGSVSSFVNVVMELKKCCNHAVLVKPIDNPVGDNVNQLIRGSGKLMLLDKLLVRLKETGHRVLIFSQMVRMLDIIAEYLQQKRFAFQRLDGSIKGDIRKQALDHFNAEGSTDFCFLLSTRAGGLGINLATADTVIIFDSDWNPQNDLQAQARAHRIGQKNQVNIYRLVTKSSVEEDIVERAKQKMVLDHLVIQRMDTTGRTVLEKGSKTGTPFNKEELNAILKFGAEELFKEDENDGEDHCDIDEILRRAETHEDAGVRPGDELLSAFKVASFHVNEEEEEQPPSKDWESIIPEDVRNEIEAQEKEKELADLYLPPRSSRTAAGGVPMDTNGNTANNTEALKKIRRKRKREAHSDDDSDSDGRPKKRGRPKAHGKDGVKGFTDVQIRKFIKSFKRFPKPLSRIELIAKDSGLTEKPIADLKKLGEQLIKGCELAMVDMKLAPNGLPAKVHIKEEVPAEGGADPKKKPREKGPVFKVAGINVNARTLSLAIDELKPLAEFMPEDFEARKSWKFELKSKVPPYDVDWGQEDDTKLLKAVWELGTGAWEAVREYDPVLKEKVFLEADKEKKPQLKHIQLRAEYLMRVIKKHLALTQKTTTKKPRKAREKKGKGGDNAAAENQTNADGLKVKDDKSPTKEPRSRKPKKAKGPLHITAHAEPTPISVLDGLDPKIFNDCKEKMRPVKNALKSLDNPDTTLSEKEQIRHTRVCLIAIGDQIQKCLEKFPDPAENKHWKSHLWFFVSKFTEYDPQKLYRLYRKASKKNESRVEKEKSKSKESSKHHKAKKESKEVKPSKTEHKKEKEKVHSRSFNDNSNSSHSHHHETDKKATVSTKPPNYDRDRKRERFAREMGEIPPGTSRVPPVVPPPPVIKSEETSNGPSVSPKKLPPQVGHVPNGPSSSFVGSAPGARGTDFNQYNQANTSGYRGERSRDRERDQPTGDPRDRVGRHAGKNYRSDRDSYDRDRDRERDRGDRDRTRNHPGGPPYERPDRVDRSGRPWAGANQQRTRWGPADSYNGPPRRPAGSSYYGGGGPGLSPTGGPSPPNHFGNPGYGPGGPPPSSHHANRVTPSNVWRRNDSLPEIEPDQGINARPITEDSPPDAAIHRRMLY